MLPKHMEMDTIVMGIYDAMNDRPHLNNTLFVLCGDHGMTDGGNHGGSGAGETSPALVFLAPKLRPLSPGRKSPVSPMGSYNFYKKVDQSDLAPTISTLMGLPIPKNNLGVMIPEFLGLWKNRESRFLNFIRF
jgi:ethanolaminephosphotransferase